MLDPALTSKLTPQELATYTKNVQQQLSNKNWESQQKCEISNKAQYAIIDRVFNLQLKFYARDLETKKAAASTLIKMKNSS